MTLKRRQVHEDSPSVASAGVEQRPISFTIYSILAQSQAKFTLVKSRELLLPAQLGERASQVGVVAASISINDSLIVVGLSNGRLWIFSLDEIGWVACIASSVPLKENPLCYARLSARTPRPLIQPSPLEIDKVCSIQCVKSLVCYSLNSSHEYLNSGSIFSNQSGHF